MNIVLLLKREIKYSTRKEPTTTRHTEKTRRAKYKVATSCRCINTKQYQYIFFSFIPFLLQYLKNVDFSFLLSSPFSTYNLLLVDIKGLMVICLISLSSFPALPYFLFCMKETNTSCPFHIHTDAQCFFSLSYFLIHLIHIQTSEREGEDENVNEEEGTRSGDAVVYFPPFFSRFTSFIFFCLFAFFYFSDFF